MAKLSKKAIADKLTPMYDWKLKASQLHRIYSFKGFKEAMAFVTRVALIAEPMDHHPDIDIRYNKVVLNLSTHSEGGVTEKDFKLARAIDAV